jgi:hypothetical protein
LRGIMRRRRGRWPVDRGESGFWLCRDTIEIET